MKIASTIFSWLGWIINAVSILIVTLNLDTVIKALELDPTAISSTVLWVLFGIEVGIGLLILIWRQYAINHGHKVASGIFTLFFVSLLGGIFTLCIPSDKLN